MTTPLNEYRFTRPHLYSSPGCPGHKDPRARQGYYVIATSEPEAYKEVLRRYPEFTGQKLDVEFWRHMPV
jgi:hypothetical protein